MATMRGTAGPLGVHEQGAPDNGPQQASGAPRQCGLPRRGFMASPLVSQMGMTSTTADSVPQCAYMGADARSVINRGP